MVRIFTEKVQSNFEGTIIDIETIGNFCGFPDSRRYMEIIPVIFGYISNDTISILYVESKELIGDLKNEISSTLDGLEHPFYAFNCDFEAGVLYHSVNKKITFEGELNEVKYERKGDVVSSLGLPQYGDPFHDTGKLCMDAWMDGRTEEAIAHNRSCLLKERDILLKRNFREPDLVKFCK